MKKKNKLICMLIVIALLVSLLPALAYAEGDSTDLSMDAPEEITEPAGNVKNAGGQYAINLYYNTSWGSVVAKVDNVEATSADGGDLVYLTITPASGYEFQSAGVIVRNSDQESVLTVPQTDGTISFQMPNSAATVTVQFTKAEDDEPATPTPVDEVSLVVSQPAVGETTDAKAPDVTAKGWMYKVTDTSWVDSSGNALSAPLTFESDATYYIVATVESYWESDATYFFPQSSDMTVSVENGSLVGTPSITNVYGAASTMQVLIAVQPVVRRSADQVQIWIGSIDGNTTMAQSGGKVATSYTPSEPNIYDFGKNGEYKAGDIVQFYSGDEITVTAQADAGHRFVGWYRVNIDYNMSGGDADHNGSSPNKAYSGSAFSTAASFTYKPGETVLSGDAEPLRYVCAVFEDDAAPSHNANEIQVWIGDISGNEQGDNYTGGNVAVLYTPSYDDYPEDVVAKDGTVYEHGPIFGCYEGDEFTLTARPDAGYSFVGWYLADGEWPANGPERYTGGMLSSQTTYTFDFTGSNRLICAVFKPESDTHTVTFDSQGGSAVEAQVVADGGYATKPAKPLKDGVYFLGWFEKPGAELTRDEVYSGGFKFTDTPITGNKKLYAVWYAGFYGATYDLSAQTPKYAETGGDVTFTATYQQKPSTSKAWWDYSIVQGSQVSVTAIPAEGARFVGWAPGTLDADGNMPNDPSSLGDIVSTENPYTFTFEGKTALAALFEKDTVTVTFDAKGGTPVPEAQTFQSGGKATAPTSPVKEGWTLRGWYTDDSTFTDETRFDFNTSVTEDMTLYAGWMDSFVLIPFNISNNSPGGGGVGINGSDPQTGVIVMNIFYGQTNTLVAAPDDGYVFAGWSSSTSEDDIISNNAEYSFASAADLPNLYALFKEKPITVTIHASTREGELDEEYAPIVCDSVPKGLTYNQAMDYIEEAEGSNFINLNNTGRYSLYAGWNTKQSFSTYADENAASSNKFTGSEILSKDTDIYIPYSMVAPVEISVASPICGQSAASVAPEVTMPEGVNWNGGSPDGYPKWVVGESNPGTYTGDITGGNDYYIYVIVNLPFGYFSNNNSTAVVNGGEFVTNWMTGSTSYGFFAKVTAVHDPAEPVKENVEEPTCTEAGSHEEVVYCKGCETVISFDKVVDEALGHDWSEWTTVKEATETEEGLEQRECKRCKETETRVIPVIAPKEKEDTPDSSPVYLFAAGKKAVWQKGSTSALDFMVIRNPENTIAFEHFTGIEVDGNTVGSENYNAVSGSVKLSIKASYLETLTAGKHDLKVLFDDGSASTGFTILSAKADGSDPKTGDDSVIGILTGIVIAGLMLLIAVTAVSRNRKNHEE